MRTLVLFALWMTLAASGVAQQETAQPQDETEQPAVEQQPAPVESPYAAPKPGHPLDPADVQTLTRPAETSIPAAQRGGYGAPQVYMNYPYAYSDLGVYAGRPVFLYRRRVPLFFAPSLNPFGGAVVRRTPVQPFLPFLRPAPRPR